MRERILQTVKQVVSDLATKRYSELAQQTDGRRLSADHLAAIESDYGVTLVAPPDDAYELLDVVEVARTNPRSWSVVMPLWTRDQGRSDLSLELTLIEAQPGQLSVEIDDIHVL